MSHILELNSSQTHFHKLSQLLYTTSAQITEYFKAKANPNLIHQMAQSYTYFLKYQPAVTFSCSTRLCKPTERQIRELTSSQVTSSCSIPRVSFAITKFHSKQPNFEQISR